MKPNIVNQYTGEQWVYTETVKDHFFNPRNFLMKDPEEGIYDAVGQFGSPACGDVMKMWLKVDPESERITELKWQTFGCASAIAATSMFSEMVTENDGMTVDEALAIKPKDITGRLGGLPDRKLHCSVLADKAFREAAYAYFRTTNQEKRIPPGATTSGAVLCE